jgi:sortase A
MQPRISRHAGLALLIAGLLLTGYGLFEAVGGKIYQAWRGRQLDRVLDSLPAQPATPQRVSYRPGSAIGRLEIPRIGISSVVLEGSDTDTLQLGVGRLRNSSLPGEPGNVVLAAHRDTFFRPLRDIRHGDKISLRTPQGTFAYTVDWTKVVDPSDIEVLKPTAEPALTLVTCYPFYYIGSAPQRFIVRALPPGRASAVAAKPSPFAEPAPRARVRTQPPAPVVTAAAIDEAPPPPPEPEPQPETQPAKRGIKGAFHKLARVFGAHRAKVP